MSLTPEHFCHQKVLERESKLVKSGKRCAAECAGRFEPMSANTGFFATPTRALPCGLGSGQVIDFRW